MPFLYLFTIQNLNHYIIERNFAIISKNSQDNYQTILSNCIIEKSKGLPDNAIYAVRSICSDIANNPSLLEKFKYGF